AAKPWSTLSRGLSTDVDPERKMRESEEMKKYARKHFPNIAKILNRVPREMLLILKTNDLLRGIETNLGTKDMRTSLITMSQNCVKSIYERESQLSRSYLARFLLNLAKSWILFKLYCYQL